MPDRALPAPRGFTVLEVLAAMTIGALVILAARVTVEQLSLGASRITAAHRGSASQSGRERWIRGLLRRAGGGTAADTTSFRGEATVAEFATTCEAPGGWLEACRARLGIDRADSGYTLSAWTTLAGRVVLGSRQAALALRYLAPSDTGMSWVREWDHSVLPPAAIAVVGVDTTIYRIGRGQ